MVNISDFDLSKICVEKGLEHGLCSICEKDCVGTGICVNCPDFVLNSQYKMTYPKKNFDKELIDNDVNLEETLPDIPLPSDGYIKLRKQNPACNAQKHYCAITGEKNLVCLIPINEPVTSEVAGEKYTELFDIKPCSKNSTGKVMEFDN